MLDSHQFQGNPQPWEAEEFQAGDGKSMSLETMRTGAEIHQHSNELQQLKMAPAGGRRQQRLSCVAGIDDDHVGPRSVSAPVGKLPSEDRETMYSGPLPDSWGRMAGSEPEPELAGSANSGSWGLGQGSERTSQSSVARVSEGELAPSEARIRSELLANPRYAIFVAQLEGESVRFRDALNAEKQKLVDMKHAEQKKRQLWKAELEKIEAELRDKGLLEKRLVQSQAEVEQLKYQLQSAGQSEQAGACDSGNGDLEENLAACQRELEVAKVKLKKTESMNNDLRQYNTHQQQCRKQAVLKAAEAAQRIASRSPTPANRAPRAVEPQDLALPAAMPQASARPLASPGAVPRASPGSDGRGRSMQDIFGLFISHVQEPLQAVRASCQESLDAAGDPFADKCPPGPTPIDVALASDDEYVARLVSIVEVLRCFAKARRLHGSCNELGGASLCTPTSPLDTLGRKGVVHQEAGSQSCGASLRTPAGPWDAFGPRGEAQPEAGSPSFGQVCGSTQSRRFAAQPFKTVFSGAGLQESFDVHSHPSEVRRSQSSFTPFDRGGLRSDSSRAEDRSESPMRLVRAKTAFGLGLIGGGSAAIAAACVAPAANATSDGLAPLPSQGGDRMPQPCAGDSLAATAPESGRSPRSRGTWLKGLLGEHTEIVAEWFLSDRDRSPRT